MQTIFRKKLHLEPYIQSLIEKKIIPGLTILVGKQQQVIYQKTFGYRSVEPLLEIAQRNDIYDLASLTKPLITAFVINYLADKNYLQVEDSIRKYLPKLPFDCSILDLLTHRSGLPAWYPFYLFDQNYLSQLQRITLAAKPGKKVNYSCVGYIVLYFLIAEICQIQFSDVVQQVICQPLHLKNTFLNVPLSLIANTVPTEQGNEFEKKMAMKDYYIQAVGFKWRDQMIRGETHDCNSYYLGGCCGNAGAFSTVNDLFVLSGEFFEATATILSPLSVKRFWLNYTPLKSSNRTLGFKLNSSLMSSGGKALAKNAIGHNGFTGTSIWFEAENQMVYIILSNRIHPAVAPINFDKIRRKIHTLLKTDPLIDLLPC